MSSPSLSDFSKKATRNAVIANTMQYPLTMFPIGIGILGALGSFLFGPGLITSAAMYGGFGVGVGTWLVNFLVRNNIFANEYLLGLQKKIEEENEKLLRNLKTSLAEFQGEYGQQGADQFEKIQAKFRSLDQVLRSKLNEGELTYRRYLGTAEQVYHSVLDNLQHIATSLQSVSTIDVDYIRNRLKSLKNKKNLDPADHEEEETLKKRLELRESQLKRVNELLTRNEQAMTELDQTTSALASVQTTQGRSSVDLETALEDLERLAERAERMSVAKDEGGR